MQKMPRWARWVARIIFAPLGGILGYIIFDSLAKRFEWFSTGSPMLLVYSLISAFALGIVFLFVGPWMCKNIYNSVRIESSSLKNYSPETIISATIGLMCGLFVAFLVTQLYSYISNDYRILVVLLSIITYMALGTVGMIVGVNNLKNLIKPQSTTTVRTPKVLDSSILIDGRISEIVQVGFLTGPLVISNAVLNELKAVADSPDQLKRNRGRRGLDVVKQLQNDKSTEVVIDESVYEGDTETKLFALAKDLKGEIVTVNYNLCQLAKVKQIKTLNLNDLANAVKPMALAGEKMTVEIVKNGKDKLQGVGFLDDGTMIVVENGGDRIGETVETTVTSTIQTSTGRIIFTRIM